MEGSHDEKLKQNHGGEKEKLKNSQTKPNIKNTRMLHGSDKFKSSPKHSPKSAHKKSTQSNTINTWLTKDVMERNVGKSEKKKLPQISNDTRLDRTHASASKSQKRTRDNSQSSSSKSSSPKCDENPTEQSTKRKNKKKRQRDKSQEHVECKESVNSTSKKSKVLKCKSNSSSDSLQESSSKSTDLTTAEHVARKKFKRILTPPLSPIRPLNKFSKNHSSPQSNTISKWLDKRNYNSNSISSTSDESTKEKLKKREVKENNYKGLEKENSSSASNRKKFKCSETETKLNTNEHSEKSKNTANYKMKSHRNDEVIKSTKKTNAVVPEKSSKDKQKLAGSSLNSTIKKILNGSSTSNKSNMWLSKDVERPIKRNENHSVSTSTKHRDKSYKKHKSDKKSVSDCSEKSERTSKKQNKIKRTPEQTLDKYISKCLKDKQKHSSTNTSLAKTDKSKPSGSSDLFKKYGVTVPFVEEIRKEQKDFAKYKNQIESYGEINEEVFKLTFSVKDVKDNEIVDNKNILDCKHLSVDSIEKAFYKNFDYISDIFHGRKHSWRHEMFFNDEIKNNNQLKYSVKDLRCSTSTIVFSYEQKEHILILLMKEFDPDDKHTLYFFHVLLPELCLKIFMDTHNMTYDEAVQYLDTSSIVN